MLWSEMTQGERNQQIATAMGWKYNPLGDAWERPGLHWIGCDQWNPATDYADVRLVEDEIERRGSATTYGRTLRDIVWSGEYPAYEYPDAYTWALIRATPEQRCEAAYRAMLDSRDSS